MLSNIDQMRGRFGIALGRFLELAGTLLHSHRLEHRGQSGQRVGRVRAAYGDAVARVARRGH